LLFFIYKQFSEKTYNKKRKNSLLARSLVKQIFQLEKKEQGEKERLSHPFLSFHTNNLQKTVLQEPGKNKIHENR